MHDAPGGDRRDPDRGLTSWSVRVPLARWLRAEGAQAAGLRVLDVGCGVKPYRPFFAAASEYVGIDVEGNPHADVHGVVEELPVPDESFDIVLCLQVLEHVEFPDRAVRELHRVTRPGGRVLASTHGTMVYHPRPEDHWRWTHTGLERLFSRNGDWTSVAVDPGAGTTACLGMLLAHAVDLLTKRMHAMWLGMLVNRAVNGASAALDGRVAMLREPIPGSIFANYHVTAIR